MPRDCKLCNSPIREEIEARWLNGISYRDLETVCKEMGEDLSHTAIWRHMSEHAFCGSPEESIDFLRWWFEGGAGYVEIRPIPNRKDDRETAIKAVKARRSFTTKDFEALRDYFARGYQSPDMARCGWYFGTCLRDKPVQRTQEGRWIGGSAEDVVACPGAWADVDDHGREDDEERMAQAERVLVMLAEKGFVPSAVVRSGGGRGRHLYFKFMRPVDPETGRRIVWKLAKVLSSDLNVADVARVMRIPGSMHTRAGRIVKVTVEELRKDALYRPDELETAIDEIAEALGVDLTRTESVPSVSDGAEFTGDWKPVPAEFVEEQLPTICARFKAYVQDPNIVSEPIWHKMACLLKSMNPDSSLFHKWSEGYDMGPDKRYNWSETERKFRSSRPLAVRCSTFQELDPMSVCAACRHFQRGSSPATFVRRAYAAQLGLPGLYGAPDEADGPKMDGLPTQTTEEALHANGGTRVAAGAEDWVEAPEDVIVHEPVAWTEDLSEAPEDNTNWSEQPFTNRTAREWARAKKWHFVYIDEEKGKEHLLLRRMATTIKKDFNLQYFFQSCYYYDGTIYTTPTDDGEDEAVIRDFILEALETLKPTWATWSRAEEIKRMLINNVQRDKDHSVESIRVHEVWNTEPLVPFANGLLDMSDPFDHDWRVYDFSPRHRINWKLTIPFFENWHRTPKSWTLAMKDAEVDVLDFFRTTFPDDETRRSILEFLGYCLCRWDQSEECYAILYGPGQNGKSTLLGMLAKAFGVYAVTESVQSLERNRFASACLTRAAIDIVPDMAGTGIEDTSFLKGWIGNDVVRAERKFKASFEFKPQTKLIYGANELPPTKDPTHGYFRRILLYPMMERFKRQGPGWVERLRTREALSYMCYLGLLHYRQMRREGRNITESKEMLREKDFYWRANDLVKAAIDEGIIELGKDYSVPRDLLQKAMEIYAKETGRKYPGAAKLLERLRNYAPHKIDYSRPRWKGGRIHVWTGVRLGEAGRSLLVSREVVNLDRRTLEYITLPVTEAYARERNLEDVEALENGELPKGDLQ